jgi:uncharacterized protein (TIGR02996 family)
MPPKPAFPQPAATLPGEADILATVVADLSDDTAKLVYADWLEDRDDPRGPLLRKSVVAFRAGKKLPPAGKAAEPWRDLVGLTLMGFLRERAWLLERADRFLRLARPALTFRSAKTADAKLRVGASKFGGRPDMPAETEWPTYQGEPLDFLAQFDLAELHTSFVCRELPAAGVLSVFYAADWQREVWTNDDTGGWRVFHFPRAAGLVRRDPPEDAGTPFPSCRLRFAEISTVPDVNSLWDSELGFRRGREKTKEREEDVSAYIDFVIARHGLEHRLLGYPVPKQGDVIGRKTVRHLLTIAGDWTTGWDWCSGGALYFTIAEENLKAGRFDRVRFEMQR